MTRLIWWIMLYVFCILDYLPKIQARIIQKITKRSHSTFYSNTVYICLIVAWTRHFALLANFISICFRLCLMLWSNGPLKVTKAANFAIIQTMMSTVQVNLRSGSIFVLLWKLHSGGHGEMKREPDTNLLQNVCRPPFWSIDICRISQPKLLPLLVFLVCKFFTRGKNADWLT